MSTIVLKDFLQNAITPIDRYSTEQAKRYGWVYVKQNKSVRYLELTQEDSQESLEKIFSVMKKQLNGLTPINYAEKNQLKALKAMIAHHTEVYKEKNKGCMGKAALYFRGVYHGTHIDKLSLRLQSQINELLQVDTGTTPLKERQIEDRAKREQMSHLKDSLSAFLKKGSVPIEEDVQEQYRWAYCKETKAIKYCDLSDEVQVPGVDQYVPCKLEKVFSRMKREIRKFKKVDLVDATQKLQLAKLRERVLQHRDDYRKQNSGCLSAFANLRERMRYGEVRHLSKRIVRDIDFLLHEVNVPSAPDFEVRVTMQRQAQGIASETLSTEESFAACVDASLNAITQLIQYSQGTYQCGHESESFFRGSSGICLASCKIAFLDVKEKSAALIDALRAEGTNGIAEIYCSQAFTDYAIAMRLAARYYEGPLQALMKRLSAKNKGLQSKLREYSDTLTCVITRMPRHQMLMMELLKNTPNDSESYSKVFYAWEAAEMQARVLNNGLAKKL
jgi:hypothetical protein